VAFASTAVITLIVAWAVALWELFTCLRLGRNPLIILDHRSTARPLPMVPRVAAARRFLDALCDLQAVTGAGIVVSGLVNFQTISLYHAHFVIGYSLLCLNSFWAGRPSCVLEEASLDSFRLRFRRFMFLASVSLSVVLQGIVFHRQATHWDLGNGKRCFVSHDLTPDGMQWLWLVGSSSYGLVLCFTLSNKSIRLVRASTHFQQRNLKVLWKRLAYALEHRDVDKQYAEAKANGLKICKPLFAVSFHLHWLAIAILFLVCFAIVHFLSIFSYGTGLYVLEVSVYSGFAARNLYNIIDRKISNKILLVPPEPVGEQEMSWGFGQVLPVVLMVTLVYQVADLLRGMGTPDKALIVQDVRLLTPYSELKENSVEYKQRLAMKSCEEAIICNSEF
jgi:hypothetical protein